MRQYKNYFALTLILVATLFASCTDDVDYSKGNRAEETFGLKFPSSQSVEIAPDDEATVTYEVKRKDVEGEVTLPVIITENTDEVFKVSPITFADGDSVAIMNIDFSKAEVGKSYSLKLEVNDPEYVNNYSTGNHFSLEVIKIKWNLVGQCMYTDDILTAMAIDKSLTYPVTVYERDDKKGLFRIEDTYKYFAMNEDGSIEPSMWDSSQDHWYITIDAQDPEHVTIPYAETGLNVPGGGKFYVWSMADYYLVNGDSASADKNYGKYEFGEITFPAGSLLASLDVYGNSFYPANGAGAFKLVIDPTQKKYEADPKYDFDWEAVFTTGLYTSEILGYSGVVALYKGTCNVKKDGCDTIFANNYGDLYKIENVYGMGEDLYFTVKDGMMGVPGSDYRMQFTGIQVLGQNVYAKINVDASTYADKLITLNITFMNEDGSIVFGTSDDIISNITYSEWGQGIFTYNGLYGGQSLVQISKRDDAEVYRLHDLFEEGYDIDFTWNRETNEVAMEPQYVCEMQGFKVGVMDLESSGLADMAVEGGYVEDPRSYFDPATNTFYFTTIYVDLLSGQVLADESGAPLIGDKETLDVVSSVENGKLRTVSLGDSFKNVAKTIKASSVRKFGKKIDGVGLTPKKVGKTLMNRKNNLTRFVTR